MSAVAIIGCVVGVVGCVVGVATFISAQLTKAKQDGVMMEKIDQCVKGIGEIKSDMKEKNKELDRVIDEHSQSIAVLQNQMKTVFRQLNIQTKEG